MYIRTPADLGMFPVIHHVKSAHVVLYCWGVDGEGSGQKGSVQITRVITHIAFIKL